MKNSLLLLLIVCCAFVNAQNRMKMLKDIVNFQKELNAEYLDASKSPLRGNNFMNFKEHPFFPVNLKYHITAKFTKTDNPVPFDIPTSSGRVKKYQEFGKADFQIDGKNYTLKIYQSLDMMKKEEYKDYLFLPFRDETNGKETYGGGKYMDLRVPKGNEIILDFNQSYQPFCAYNASDYSCPVVPEENRLSVRIEAGVMYEDIYH